MTDFLPLKRLLDRLENEKNDSDTAACYSLLFIGEVITKTIALSIASFLSDRPDKFQYKIYFRLVRASGIGEWVDCLREMMFGPSSQYVDDNFQAIIREITEKTHVGSWQHDSVSVLHEILCNLEVIKDKMPLKASIFDWFNNFVLLRNKTRGHGALTSVQCSFVAKKLEQSVLYLIDNIQIFRLPWAYLRRNLSGKYRVSYISTKTQDFDFLKSPNDVNIIDGVYIFLRDPHHVNLIDSDADLSDFYYANGGFTDSSYEMLSYESNSIAKKSSATYLQPIETPPKSETQGLGILDISGNCFSNIPPNRHVYINRNILEKELKNQVLLLDQHPIISLSGPGGIGKTTLVIKVLNEIMHSNDNPFYCIIWFSARDIDLLSTGPKQVTPHLITKKEFADEYVRLVNPQERTKKDFSSIEFLSSHLSQTPTGPTLFVFDNFETVMDQKAVYAWLDSFIRLPNKIIITTRARSFKADYPLHVYGMTKEEAKELVNAFSKKINRNFVVSSKLFEDIYRESNGHPYVIKILVGRYISLNKKVDSKKIIETQDELLTALFERTFDNLSPLAKKILLLLSSWYSMVPEVAIEAIQLRSSDEPIDVKAALEELIQTSFIEEIISDTDGQVYLNVPFVAAAFGKKKLKVSPLKVDVEIDMEFMQLIGPINKKDIAKGLFHKIESFVNKIARQIVSADDLNIYLPTLEIIARRVSSTWILIARLFIETYQDDYNKAKEFYLKYLETPDHQFRVSDVWSELIMLSYRYKEYKDELHFLVEHSISQSDDLSIISENARKMSNVLRNLKRECISMDGYEKTIQVKKMIDLFLPHQESFSSTDCIRLAWLYNAIGDIQSSYIYAERGLDIDPDNLHCKKYLDGESNIQDGLYEK